MKKTLLSLSISALLLSPAAFAKDFVLTDVADNTEVANWTVSSNELGLCVFRFVRPPVPVSSGQAFRCDPASMI